MPSRRPTVTELAVAVRRLLERPDPASSYERRVAVNVLGILERELTLGTGIERADQERLSQLLGCQASTSELREMLCERIACGELDAQRTALLSVLRASTLQRLAIDNPRYPAYVRAVVAHAHPPEQSS